MTASTNASSDLNRERAARLREQRRASGLVEMTIWIDAETRAGVDAMVEQGRYPTKAEAIAKALRRAFAKKAKPANQ